MAVAGGVRPGQPFDDESKLAELPFTCISPATQTTHGKVSGGMTPICTIAWILRCEFAYVPLSFEGVQPTAVTVRSYVPLPAAHSTLTVKPPVPPRLV